MKKQFKELKGFLIGVLITSIVLFSTPVFANSIAKTVSALLNTSNVKINGTLMTSDNLMYNNKLYIQADEVAKLLNKSTSWDATSKTYSINDKVPTVQNKEFLFRKVYLGMSKDDVIKAEGKEPEVSSDKNFLNYLLNLDGLEVKLTYVFNDNGQLYGIMINSLETHTNKNEYINDFNQLTEIFINKYGSPDFNQAVWKNDLYKDDEQDYGLAVSIGHLSYMAQWAKQDYQINTILYGDNFDITLAGRIISTKLQAPKLGDGI